MAENKAPIESTRAVSELCEKVRGPDVSAPVGSSSEANGELNLSGKPW